MAGAGPPPAIGEVTYRAFRAIAGDLPEDFIARLGPGLSTDTKERLGKGLQILREVRRLDRAVTAFAFAGAVVLFGGSTVAALMGAHHLGPLVFLAAFLSWTVAFALFVDEGLLYLRYRTPLREVMAFHRAMQGSSLARDLA